MEPAARVALQPTTYVLYPDRRDMPSPGRGGPVAQLERLIGRRLHGMMFTDLAPVAEMHHLISACDWQHPVLVVHRTGGDTRWSYTLLHHKNEEESCP